ncbi:hypothetical protein TeGR_g7769 [Tetraparma gracilis]|uniref:Uncharacterized protein n=1 Tax=Tetraparma gracilis TaxID=2962635 RepID=A0ABQ6MJN4_9STRA|nr:hypothetical protein TeGR_g7769 [Tetraparma gracilis]
MPILLRSPALLRPVLLPKPLLPFVHRTYSTSLPSLGRSHKIVGKKGLADQAKALVIMKLSKQITRVCAAAGGDRTDLRVQSVLAKARRANMTKDAMTKALVKGEGGGAVEKTTAVRYDGILKLESGPVVSVIALADTDNVKRTGPKVRNIFSGGRKDNSHGELQKTGVHDFLFRNCASVSYRWPTPEDEDYEAVTSSDLEEQIMDAALESGADDVEFGEDGRGEAVCAVEDARKVQEAIRGAIGGEGEEGEVDLEIGYRVTDDGNAVEVKGDAAEQLDKLLGMLDELEDITDVYHNAKVEYDDEEED